MIDIPTLLPGISSLPPSLMLLILLPVFPLLFMHLSAGTHLPAIPLPFPTTLDNEDLLRTGALIGIAAITALGMGLWPGALEGLSLWVKQGDFKVDFGVDVSKWLGDIRGLAGGRSVVVAKVGARKAIRARRPSPKVIAANHLYALRYYYKSWYNPTKPQPKQAIFVGLVISIALYVLTAKILQAGYEYKPPPEPKPEGKSGGMDPWVRAELDKRKSEKEEETLKRLQKEKTKQDEMYAAYAKKNGKEKMEEKKKEREEEREKREKELKVELEKRGMKYVGLDDANSKGEKKKGESEGKSKSEETKDGKDGKKSDGTTSVGNKLKRLMFGKNIAEGMKEDQSEGRKEKRDVSTSKSARIASQVPAKGPDGSLRIR